MRDYGKVYTAFWTSEDARSLTEDARTLALYLLTCPHGNMLGCFRLTNAYAADDLMWDVERVAKGFAELFQKGFAYRCERTFWVFIRQHLKWNQFDNPNVGKAAAKLFDQISPPVTVKALLAQALREFSAVFPTQVLDKFEAESEPFQNPFETVSKTVAVAVAGTVTVAEGIAPQSVAAPKKAVTAKPETDTSATWAAYAEAYFDRYGTEPVRNAKVNGQLADFVKRLGREEAPQVASFFVSHNNAFYVRGLHGVGTMLADAEKLRTEWATNSRMTQTKALQADKTATNLDAFAPLIAAARAKEEAERNANA